MNNGTWYKNGPLRTKGKHPFLGKGNILKMDFKDSKCISIKNQEIVIPTFNNVLPRYDKKGLFYKNEGNISVVKHKNDILAISEMMKPYVFDKELNSKMNLKYFINSGVHPISEGNIYWNSYIYGNTLVIFKNNEIYKSYKLNSLHYTHDFFKNEKYFVWIVSEVEFNPNMNLLKSLSMNKDSSIIIYDIIEDKFTQIPFPISIKNRTCFHIGNVMNLKNQVKIQTFMSNIHSFHEISQPWDLNSIPVEITCDLENRESYLTQYWSTYNGDMPKVNNKDEIIFVGKHILHLWNPKDYDIKTKQFSGILEEPIWTIDNFILLIEHYNDYSNIHVIDDKLNIVNTDKKDKLNYSFHGTWIEN